MHRSRFLAAVLCAVVVGIAPARAERPIVDLHRLDAYFQLFAGDSSAPWKPTAVRLDTYSSAPVAFSVYRVDPADVLLTGSSWRSRAIVTAGRRPVLSFAFTPPGGYQFQSNEVSVPLGSREGFFVVEARRGDVGEQVWINRSRIGVISKETQSGLFVYGADLGTGMSLARMRVQFVGNHSVASALTNNDGIATWNRWPRPLFVLAQWGDSYAFLSLLPQAPLPATIVGVRVDSAVVHAGDDVRVAGFARTRSRGILRAATGTVLVSLRDGATAIAQRRVGLDEAGAFATSFALPQNATAGEYAVLAQADGAVGGATVNVDANAGGLSLTAGAACGSTCDPRQDVPLAVHASQGGVTVHVVVVRSPHVDMGEAADATWGASRWLDASVRTDGGGNATVAIPHPADDLASTYGVHAESGGATADTRIVVPTAQATIRVRVDHDAQGLGAPVGFDVDAQALDGRPLAGDTATVTMMHGTTAAQQSLRLDDRGHARGSFRAPELGTNLIFASVDRGGRATDATEVQIEPQAPAAFTDGASAGVRLSLDKDAYRPNEQLAVDAAAAGSQGDALVTFESALGVEARVVRVSGGRVVARLRAVDAAGDLRVGAAFVRDGAIEWATAPLALAAPGRPHVAHIALPAAPFAPGAAANVALDDAALRRGTFVIRISRGIPSGSALFSSAPALLAIGETTTQNSAPDTLTWHPCVNSTGDHAQVLGFVRRTQPPQEASLAQADSQAVAWSVQRAGPGAIAVPLPASSGRYTLSVLEISDDGSVSEGSSAVVVR